jgi:GTPase SAR1 family protein
MGAKMKQRDAVNQKASQATLSVNERILKECHQLYTDVENGLVEIASNLDFKLLAPRKKITIMLIGNHSAGKSSFINWYIEEHVQRTGVAIETQGFSFVTSGRKRESLTGNATLHLYPHFKPLSEFPGLLEYISTEISTSKTKKFPLVTFVDTPGLVDGDMNYPFDVNEAILWLGDLVDMIFVFFDPIGQALCKRTLNIVEALSQKHSEKIRFYLSKADEAGHESDRQRVMMQIVQELCKRPGLNRTGFDMPTIYIPNPNKTVRCVNQIDDVCRDVEKTINQTIQNTLNQLERDCDQIGKQVDHVIAVDNASRSHNNWAMSKGVLSGLMGLLAIATLVVNFLTSSLSDKLIKDVLGRDGYTYLTIYLAPLRGLWRTLPTDYHGYALITMILLSTFLLVLAKWVSRRKDTITRKRKKLLLDQQEFVKNVVKDKKVYISY